MTRPVLLLSTTTGYQLRSFDAAARALGVPLRVATDRCHSLDDPWRDAAIPVRFHDEEASLAAVLGALRSDPPVGVIAVGDRPIVLAARIAEAFGIPGNPPAAAAATQSKRQMRRAFAAAGMPVPWFADLPNDADPRELARTIRYPCVVKPLGLSASRGVIRANDPQQFLEAVARVRALLSRPSIQVTRSGLHDRLLVEGYIDGPEYAVEGVLIDGVLKAFAIFEKPDPLEGPFFEETIYVTPPEMSALAQRQIVTEVQRATAALGLVHGPVHAECRATREGVVMLEVAARPIGGLCSRVLRFATDAGTVSLEDALLRQAVGDDISHCARESAAAGVMMIPIARRGIYRAVRGLDEARAVPFVEDVEITAKTDQLLEPLPEGDSYLGFIFARAPHRGEVVSSLKRAYRRLKFEIQRQVVVTA